MKPFYKKESLFSEIIFMFIHFTGQNDLKNMISPSSSNANKEAKESRNERSMNLSKLDQLNQVSNLIPTKGCCTFHELGKQTISFISF